MYARLIEKLRGIQIMEKKGRGGARKGAGRKSKSPYVKRKTGAWNVEAWIPPALQQLAKAKGLDSASDIVNEALRALCFLHGYQELEWLSRHPDPNKTARWRFFSEQELQEVVEALSVRWHGAGNPSQGPLHDVWLSAWNSLEPRDGPNWRHSILESPNTTPHMPVAGPGLSEGAQTPLELLDKAETLPPIDLETIETRLKAFEQALAQDEPDEGGDEPITKLNS